MLVHGLQRVTSTEISDRVGNTPFILAARNGHIELERYLVEHTEAEIEAVDENGWTAFIKAASKGCIEIVRYMVETFCARDSSLPRRQEDRIPRRTFIARLIRGGVRTTWGHKEHLHFP
uniref:Uncharacterized protein n=1 Tax=Lotharella oceanica TaxID=641309 RepID=A0A7S2XE90_9EUKA|mmetsp:Transcript_33223/g.61729  ORF Transcript_33223/g.61729 Transcript_33223/m.61729 type:complete len:119 (+) Transcript_33223:730-1086(+)